jgi:hypothetical protein
LLLLKKTRPMAVRTSSFTIAKSRRFILPIACVKMSLIGVLKLVSNCLLQAPKMFWHCFYRQTCIRSCIVEARNILKWCYYRLHLLVVLPIPLVNLFSKNVQQFSQSWLDIDILNWRILETYEALTQRHTRHDANNKFRI